MSEKILLRAVLCFPVKRRQILLAYKTKGIGKGFWNGYGGGIEDGETPIIAARRELGEEAEIFAVTRYFRKKAVVDFHNTTSDGTEFTCRVHVYLVSDWDGVPRSTKEMIDPTWFLKKDLPVDKMAPADREWLPEILKGKTIFAEAWLGPFQRTLLKDVVIREATVEELEALI